MNFQLLRIDVARRELMFRVDFNRRRMLQTRIGHPLEHRRTDAIRSVESSIGIPSTRVRSTTFIRSVLRSL